MAGDSPGRYSSGYAALLDAIMAGMRLDDTAEGQFAAAEAEADRLYQEVISIMSSGKPESQIVDDAAKLLRDEGYSAHVLYQLTGIPQEEINAALAAGGYDIEGNKVDAQTTQPSPNTDILDTLQDGVNAVGTTVGDVLDSIFRVLHLPSPDYTILQPNAPGGTVVWGQPSGAVFGKVGTTSGGNIVGVQTGIPAIDILIGKVADILSGRVGAGEVLNTQTIEDIIKETAKSTLGIPDLSDPADIVQTVINMGNLQNDNDAGKVLVDTASGGGSGWKLKDPYTDTTPPQLDETVVQETGGGSGWKLKDPYTDAEPSPPDTPSQPPKASQPETPPAPPAPTGGGGAGASSQGVKVTTVEEAPLVEFNRDFFNVGGDSILPPNVDDETEADTKKTMDLKRKKLYSAYSAGGIVGGRDLTSEILGILKR